MRVRTLINIISYDIIFLFSFSDAHPSGSLDNAQYLQLAQVHVTPTKPVAPVYAALTEVYQEVQ